MKDKLGNKIKPGDVLLNMDCGYSSIKPYHYRFCIWEMPENYNGAGINYNPDGTQYLFYYARLNSSIKIDLNLIPDGFEFSFKHGMCFIHSKIEKGTVLELIENSCWDKNKVTQEQVDDLNLINNINIENKNDVLRNIELLKRSKYTPINVVYKVLQIFGIEEKNINDDLEFSRIKNELNYCKLINSLDSSKVTNNN